VDEKKLPELTEEDLKKLLEGAPAPPPHWFERPLTPETGEPGLKPVAAPNDAPITEILDDLATASQWALWEGQFVPKEAIVAPIPEEPEPIGATVAPIPEPDSSWQQSDPKQLPYVGVKGFSQVPNWYTTSGRVLGLVGPVLLLSAGQQEGRLFQGQPATHSRKNRPGSPNRPARRGPPDSIHHRHCGRSAPREEGYTISPHFSGICKPTAHA
jgi:hypothetical protein